jgi:DNA polymerase-3 subunit delta
MSATYEQTLRQVKAGQLAPLYLLYGEEPWYIDQLYPQIETAALGGAEPSFNLDVFYGPEVDARVLIGVVKSYPVMAARRVVVVRDAQRIRKDQFERLAPLFEQPVPTTTLIWLHRAESPPDRRSKSGKALSANAVVVESKKLYENKAREWAEAYAREKGLLPEPQAVYLLVEALGTSLQLLANEIDKLALRLAQSTDKRVDSALIYDAIQLDRDYNVFELINAIGNNDATRAHRIARQMTLYLKQHPPVLIVGQVQNWLFKLAQLQHQGLRSESEVARALGVAPFLAKGYVAALAAWPLGRVLAGLAAVHRADCDLKGLGGSRLDDTHIVQTLIFDLLNA